MPEIKTVGAIVVSVVALITFTGALIVAFFLRDSGLLNLTVGESFVAGAAGKRLTYKAYIQ